MSKVLKRSLVAVAVVVAATAAYFLSEQYANGIAPAEEVAEVEIIPADTIPPEPKMLYGINILGSGTGEV